MLLTAQKINFSIKDFFSKCDQIRRKLWQVTFTEEIPKGKLHFLCNGFLHKRLTVYTFNFCKYIIFNERFCMNWFFDWLWSSWKKNIFNLKDNLANTKMFSQCCRNVGRLVISTLPVRWKWKFHRRRLTTFLWTLRIDVVATLVERCDNITTSELYKKPYNVF